MSENIISLNSFTGKDHMELFANAMEYMKNNPGTTLIVPPGEYLLTSKLARETQEHVMNGDYGRNPQPTMFNPKFEYTRGVHLDGLKDCKLVAYGVSFMVDGFMEPVSVTNCENVEICGFSIDHKRKPYSKASVVIADEFTDDGCFDCTLVFGEEFPIKPKTPHDLRNHVWNPILGKVERGSFFDGIEYIDEHHLKAKGHGNITPDVEYYIVHTYHSRPAVLVEFSKDIKITDVTIHSQPGMGVVGNRSENITMTRLQVVPSLGDHMSTNTDGTHFTSIKGLLKMTDCRFLAQGDDFINVHGYYHAVVKREAGNICYLQEKTPDGTHAQTLDYPDVGDTMELTSFETLEHIDDLTVVAVEPMHEEWMCKVTFDHDLPENTDGLMLADITRLPEVEIKGCWAAEHFARSILIKTRKALIENNIFRDPNGTAIAIAAESYWYEGVCPANVVIRNNVIIDNVTSNKTAGIYVKADCGHAKGQSIHNIRIENNVIYAPNCANAMYIRNVEGLYMKNNVCITRNDPIMIEDCTNIKLS